MTAPIWVTPAGQLASIVEGSTFLYNLSFTGDSPISVELISGVLPPGLILNHFDGALSGTVGFIENQTNYEFSIRLTNSEGFADNGFSILVSNTPIMWNNPTDLGSYPPNFYQEVNFSVSDLGGTTQAFEKISGTLPPGFALNSFGKLYGVAEHIITATTYSFTVRAFLDGTYTDKAFTITIDPNVTGAPIWLTPAGSLGELVAGENFSQLLIAESPQLFPITYSAPVGSIPTNLTLDPTTGLLSGILSSAVSTVYSIPVTATAGITSTTRVFTINANQALISSVSFITPPGSLGSLNEGQPSTLGVSATTTGLTFVRYIVTAGSLPPGLTLNINTGDIQGTPLYSVSDPTTYNFTIEAFDTDSSVFESFSITINSNLQAGSARVYAALYGKTKLLFNDLFNSSNITYADIYRPGDTNFGLIRTPKILIVENLNAPTPDSVFTALSGVRRTYLTFGKVLVGQAVSDNEVIYEVLYRRIFDDSAGAAEVVEFNTNTPVTTVKPGSLTNIRAELIAAFGSSGGADILPLWMQSEQTIGDPTTIPGYVPCLEFAYTNPGSGQDIADKINASDVQLQKVFQSRVRTDRIVIEPTADTSFAPQYVLFDNTF